MKTPTDGHGQENRFENPSRPNDQLLKKEVDSLAFDVMDALQGPVLTFSTNWKDTISLKVLDIIPMARMIALLKKEELATLEECFVYISTRSLDGPLDYEWATIYNHLGCTTMERWFNKKRWEEMRAPKQLSQWHQTKLNALRQHLYNRRREILKQQLGKRH